MRNIMYMKRGVPVLTEEQKDDEIKITIFDTVLLNTELFKQVSCYLFTNYGCELLKQFLKETSTRRFGTSADYNDIVLYVCAQEWVKVPTDTVDRTLLIIDDGLCHNFEFKVENGHIWYREIMNNL